jgi:hypothetical protein
MQDNDRCDVDNAQWGCNTMEERTEYKISFLYLYFPFEVCIHVYLFHGSNTNVTINIFYFNKKLFVLICKRVFFYFVHRVYFNKITTFRKLDLLPSSNKKGRTETLAVGPPGRASLRPGEAVSET